MAIYTITISGKGNSSLARTYTIDAGTEAIAKRMAQQRLAVDPQFRNIPSTGYSVTVDFEDFAQQKQDAANSGRKLAKIEKEEREALEKVKEGEISSGRELENFARNEGEEAAALQNQSFSDFKDNFVTPGQFNPSANAGLPPQGYDTEEVIPTPDFTSGFIPNYERDALSGNDPKQALINAELAAAQLAAGGTTSPATYQTEAGRRGQ